MFFICHESPACCEFLDTRDTLAYPSVVFVPLTFNSGPPSALSVYSMSGVVINVFVLPKMDTWVSPSIVIRDVVPRMKVLSSSHSILLFLFILIAPTISK